jgi:uncharacterized protein (UPF0128 family)
MDYNPDDYIPHIYGKFRERNSLVKVRQLLPTLKKGDIPFAKEINEIIK